MRLEQVERQIRLTSRDLRPKRFGRKFDFLYAPTLRGLSTELSSLLPLHPQVFCVSKTELDATIEQDTQPALLAKYQRQLLNHSSHLKAGLIQHAYIAGQRGDPEVAEKLANVTTRKLFIQGVRDPLSLVISEFNHELIARYCGAYGFWPIVSETPFCRVEYAFANSLKYKRVVNQPPGDWLESNQQTKELVQTLLADFAAEGAAFCGRADLCEHFGSWVPVHLERPPSGQPGVLNRVLDAIGVDYRFEHPAFSVSEGKPFTASWLPTGLRWMRLDIRSLWVLVMQTE